MITTKWMDTFKSVIRPWNKIFPIICTTQVYTNMIKCNIVYLCSFTTYCYVYCVFTVCQKLMLGQCGLLKVITITLCSIFKWSLIYVKTSTCLSFPWQQIVECMMTRESNDVCVGTMFCLWPYLLEINWPGCLSDGNNVFKMCSAAEMLSNLLYCSLIYVDIKKKTLAI